MLEHWPVKAVDLARMCEPVSHITTHVLKITQTDHISSGIGKYVVINRLYGYVLKRFSCTSTSIQSQKKLQHYHEYASHISHSNHSSQ
jgi:hypothetical protein